MFLYLLQFIGENSKVDHLIRFGDGGRIQHGSKIKSDGTPFMVVGSKLMECHQGPNHRKTGGKKTVCITLMFVLTYYIETQFTI